MKPLICLVAMLAVACAYGVSVAAEPDAKDAEWAEAERAFVAFITPVINEAGERLKDPQGIKRDKELNGTGPINYLASAGRPGCARSSPADRA